jgi:hypothetical protein
MTSPGCAGRRSPAFAILAAAILVLAHGAAAPHDPWVPTAMAAEVEAEFWDRIKDSEDRLLLEMYLKAFPDGEHAPAVESRLKSLKSGATGPGPDSATPGSKVYPAEDKGWVGVVISTVEADSFGGGLGGFAVGSKVESLFDGGPAAQSGLEAGDIIVALDGKAAGKHGELTETLGAMRPGSLATLTVMRAGTRKELPVTIGGRVTDNRAAAEAGNPQSQMVLATAYHFGTGVEKDTAEAFKWAKRAAEQGVADGQTFVGYYYANGEVVEKNDYAAVEWYRKAATQNERAAFNNLGTYYETGRGGLSQNLNQAIDHYRRSAALGYQLAIDNLKRLEVDPFDLAEIQRNLAVLGHDPGPIDGKMGSKTEAAIGTFQAQAGIAVDGKPSLELARRIREARTARTPTARPAPTVESPSDTPTERPGELGNLKELDSLE